MRVSRTMNRAVLTTSFRGAPSTSRSCGSPSSVTSTVGSSAKRTLGGSFFRPCALFFSRSATFTFSSARSYEMTRFHFGTSASTISANFFSFSGVMFGKRTRFTLMRRISTERSSRSTETEAVKKMTPNFGAVSPFFVHRDGGAAADRVPFEGLELGLVHDRRVALRRRELAGPGVGRDRGGTRNARERTRRRPLTSFETAALMGALLPGVLVPIQYRTTRLKP